MATVNLNLALQSGSQIPPELSVISGNWTFQGNGLYIANSSSGQIELVDATADNDVTISFRHDDTNATGKYFSFEFRRADDNNYLRVIWDLATGVYRVQKRVSGTTTVLYDGTHNSGASATLRVVTSGSSITAYADADVVYSTSNEPFNQTVGTAIVNLSQGFYGMSAVTFENQAGSVNTKPVAALGTNTTGTVGDEFIANASNSSDADNDALTYQSTLQVPAGSSATLSDANTVNPRFTMDVAGEYILTLIVNDGAEDSDPATQTITAVEAGSVVANAGNDSVQYVGQSFVLSGAASTGGSTYSWSIAQAPVGSSASITNSTQQNASYTADVVGLYEFQLTVDGASTSSVFVRVRNAVANKTPTTAIRTSGEFELGRTVTFIGEGKYNA